MGMTKLRKKFQDKLRRKYKYSTNTNFNRGVCLNKEESLVRTFCNQYAKKYDYITDLSIAIDRSKIKNNDKDSIAIYLLESKLYEEKDDIEDLEMHYTKISFEELELIYNIACEMKKEVEINE